MDLNHEVAGLNRRHNESLTTYWNRLHAEEDFITAKKDYSLPCLHMPIAQFQNATFKTSKHTYYFSISAGEKKRKFCDRAEMFNEPKSTIKQALGFDSEILQNLNLVGSSKKLRQRSSQYSAFEYLCSFLKTLLNPLSMVMKSYINPHLDYRPPNRFNSLFNPNMNNIEAIDYSNYALT